MTDVEIIYLKRGIQESAKPFKKDVYINPSKTCNLTKKPDNEIAKNKLKTKRSFFSFKRTCILIACLFIITIIVSTSFNAGYIPINYFLEIKKPIGNITEINIEETAEKYYLPADLIPVFSSIKYKIFRTDQKIPVIATDYKKDLEKDGFNLEYHGTERIKGFDFEYNGFIKGLTAVVIIMNSDNIYTHNHETLVLYSTGSVFEYAEILKDNGGFLNLN